MALKPLFNRLIIKPEPKTEKLSKSGLVMTTQYDKTEEIHGKVIAVGSEVQFVKEGDVVSFPSYGYDSVSDATGEFMSIREPEIIAVIN